LHAISEECGRSVSQLAINWTIHRPGITAALCGSKRALQVEENAGGMGWKLTDQQARRIEEAMLKRGDVLGRSAV